MLAETVLVGRLARDPELRYTKNESIPVATFTVATNDIGSDEADFHRCVAWKKKAENVGQYLKKGSLVAVAGRLKSRSYDDKEGNRRYITEVNVRFVQFLDKKGGENKQEINDEDVLF